MASADIALQRLRRSHLTGLRAGSVVEVVRRLCAVQAQDYPGARWAVAQRTRAVNEQAIDALLAEGAILRTHVLRPTWHLVLPEDIGWLLALTAPRVRAAMAYNNRRLGLDEETFTRSNAVLAGELRGGGQATRQEVAELHRQHGIDAGGLRLAHLLMRAELDGVVCSGGLRGRQHTYALLEERAPPSRRLPTDTALGELAARYFAGHGPARVVDFAWWSGLSGGQAQRGIDIAANSLRAVVVDGRLYHDVRDVSAPHRDVAPVVRLLPSYDEYVVGYSDRTLHTSAEVGAVPLASVDLLASSVVIDGLWAARWRRDAGAGAVTLRTTLGRRLSPVERAALAREAVRLGRFLASTVTLVNDPA